MTSVLQITLNLWARTGFVPGQSDCMMSVADYWRLATGRDPAAGWRGSYASITAMQDLLAAEGGGLALMTKGFASIAVLPEPAGTIARSGDAICVDFGTDQLAGLCIGREVALRRQTWRGYGIVPLTRVSIAGIWRP